MTAIGSGGGGGGTVGSRGGCACPSAQNPTQTMTATVVIFMVVSSKMLMTRLRWASLIIVLLSPPASAQDRGDIEGGVSGIFLHQGDDFFQPLVGGGYGGLSINLPPILDLEGSALFAQGHLRRNDEAAVITGIHVPGLGPTFVRVGWAWLTETGHGMAAEIGIRIRGRRYGFVAAFGATSRLDEHPPPDGGLDRPHRLVCGILTLM